MIANKRILAIIPARGGSKRLPRKNVLPLAGKPLIVWSIEAALTSKYIDNTVISTDDPEIAAISRSTGASVPFMRPAELASDKATSADVVMHTLNYLESLKNRYDYFVLLQPTSPLRTGTDIDGILEMCISRDANTITSLCETDHTPLWENVLPSDNSMLGFISESIANTRSQDLPTYYRINGALYAAKIESFMEDHKFIASEKAFAYIMPREKSYDIDTKLDFVIAEAVMKTIIVC